MIIRVLLSLALALPLLARDPVWLVHGPDGAVARTIVRGGGGCPQITIDGEAVGMRTRSLPAKDYDVTVCETLLGHHVREASIDGERLPVEKLRRTDKIALLGDTGCRLKAGNPPSIQDCSDPKAWPFAQIAKSIADWDPDLVLHTGDYYYREAVCKSGTCTNAPYNWKRWDEDFFTPAAPLLRKAPWVMQRGNHEECSRAGEGWFRLLDPRPYLWENAKTCKSNLDITPPYVARAGAMNFLVIDTSSVQDNDPAAAALYAQQLRIYGGLEPGAWLMAHHPVWGAAYGELDTPTMFQAWDLAGDATKPISFVLTAHIHLVELLSFSDGGPPSAVVGNGGTSLDTKANDPTGQQLGKRTVTSFVQDGDFGFIAATRSATGWTFDIRRADGTSKGKCAVTSTSIVCD
jgi:hypothetical protein